MSNAEKSACGRVLVVEDEALVAMLIEDMLTDLDCHVASVSGSVGEAVRTVRSGVFDLAILDVNLGGEPTYPVAEILRERGIPFLFATGYGASRIDEKFADVPVLPKPFQIGDLARAIESVTGRPAH